MSPIKKESPRLAEVAKYPAAFVLMCVVGYLGFLLRGVTQQSELRTDDCKEQLKISQEREAKKDSVIMDMAFQLRVNESTIQQLPDVADSLTRHKIK